MNLDAAQKQKVAGWIADGMKLADIQKRIGTEFGLSMTYMDVRFLVDDLKLVPKDPEPPKALELPKPPAPDAAPDAEPESALPEPEVPGQGAAPAPTAGTGKVSVTVDQIARPGAMVSGSVTFSDGQTATWYLDQMGRLGLAPQQKGYKPSTPDVQEFQMALQVELQRMGF
jgi:hypothetical protein